MMENPTPTPPTEQEVSYLNDEVLLQLSKSATYATRRLSERINEKIERGRQLNLPYDYSKSTLIHILPLSSSLPSPQDPVADTTYEYNIPPSPSIKHLGITIDNRLGFSPHADKARAKATKSINRLQHLTFNNKGISFSTAHHLIYTYLLPQMLWASPAWWTGMDSVLKRLSVPYHQAVRWATGLPAYTNVNKMLLVARFPPSTAFWTTNS